MTNEAMTQELLTLRGHVQRFNRILDALEKSPAIRAALVPPEPRPVPKYDGPPVRPLAEVMKAAILQAHQATGGNVKIAAQLLGIGRTTCYRKLIEYEKEDSHG